MGPVPINGSRPFSDGSRPFSAIHRVIANLIHMYIKGTHSAPQSDNTQSIYTHYCAYLLNSCPGLKFFCFQLPPSKSEKCAFQYCFYMLKLIFNVETEHDDVSTL